eukprot:TRINITY_DN46840_c0_g1_i1.p1 TRINITY_DN46840_c0_g1~~TRINITY_DN46840_c0_g1_i1.p1  ORF type:complete len:491 (-),score=91.57 TRINITY_DN46840_c0_g1_i1:39-1511(-)
MSFTPYLFLVLFRQVCADTDYTALLQHVTHYSRGPVVGDDRIAEGRVASKRDKSSTLLETAVPVPHDHAALARSRYASSVFSFDAVLLERLHVGVHEHADMMKACATPALAVVLGSLMFVPKATRMAASFVIFFGAQIFMNLYMKGVISEAPVAKEQEKYGFPAPFVLTSLQLVTSFLLLATAIVASWATPYSYTPKAVRREDLAAILGLSTTFVGNIALNNYSLTMIDVSLNQVIRSGGPVGIVIVCALQTLLTGKPMPKYQPVSYACLLGAVVFAAWTVLLKSGSSAIDAHDSPMLVAGVVVCCFSVLASASNMLVVHFVGTGLKLNPIDSVFYMAIPSALLLLGPSFLLQHRVPWGGEDTGLFMTDIEVLMEVWRLRPLVIGLGCYSGLFSLVYNIFMYNIVQSLSAMAIEVASNFNKAATIGIAVSTGMEHLPPGSMLRMVSSVGGNILCVMLFGITEQRAQAAAAAAANKDAVIGDVAEKQTGRL